MKKARCYEILGKRMKELRLEMGLSVEEVAGAMGVKTSAYPSYEAGERIVRGDKLLALAKLFRVSSYYLVGRTDVKWMPFDE